MINLTHEHTKTFEPHKNNNESEMKCNAQRRRKRGGEGKREKVSEKSEVIWKVIV